MAGSETIRNRRTRSTFRHHLWLTATTATLCFAFVIGMAVVLPVAMHLRRVDPSGPEVAGLTQHLHLIQSALWPIVLASLVASIATATLLFERMRGPLDRFVRVFDALAEGVVPPQLAVRSIDYLVEETDALNSMIASLRRQQAIRSEAIARLDEIAGEFVAGGDSDRIVSELQEIAKRLGPGSRNGPASAAGSPKRSA